MFLILVCSRIVRWISPSVYVRMCVMCVAVQYVGENFFFFFFPALHGPFLFHIICP